MPGRNRTRPGRPMTGRGSDPRSSTDNPGYLRMEFGRKFRRGRGLDFRQGVAPGGQFDLDSRAYAPIDAGPLNQDKDIEALLNEIKCQKRPDNIS